MSGQVSRAELRQLPLFAELTDEELGWIETHASVLEVEPGEAIFEDGQPADSMFVLLEGEGQFRFATMQGLAPIRISDRGATGGMLPFSRMERYTGRYEALVPSRLLRIAKDDFPAMLNAIPELGQRLVAIMSDRVRNATRIQEQQSRLSALGKLSAGLAHELNNPASAVQRSAEELRRRLGFLTRRVVRLLEGGIDAATLEAAAGLRQRCTGQRGAPELGALERSEREDELGDWLEEQGAEESWVLAETLVDCGITPEALEEVIRGAPQGIRGDLLAWIEGGLAADRMLEEVMDAAARISDLVGAVKRYSHMDRAQEREAVDLAAGLESTLTMLGHKIRKAGVRVEKALARDLPAVPGYAGPLNQVWTNLLDNALDALGAPREAGAGEGGRGEQPTVRIEAHREGDQAVVVIGDNGPGIPEDIRSRIFDPFYTTKAVGEGSGLGLDIVRRIVEQHGGTIDVQSVTGRTEFIVYLPLAD